MNPAEAVGDCVSAGPLVVSPREACAAWIAGRTLPLGVRQVRMLAALVSARGRLLSREALYRAATDRPLPSGSRAVDMDLWRIRRALGPLAHFLRSVRKVGYALDVTALERAPVVSEVATDS